MGYGWEKLVRGGVVVNVVDTTHRALHDFLALLCRHLLLRRLLLLLRRHLRRRLPLLLGRLHERLRHGFLFRLLERRLVWSAVAVVPT